MVGELVDFSVHAPHAQNLLQRAQGEELHQRTGKEDHAGAAEHHGAHGQRVQIRGVDRMHFAVAHGEHRQRHHVERVLEVPSGLHVSGRGQDHDHEHEQRDADKIARGENEKSVGRHNPRAAQPRSSNAGSVIMTRKPAARNDYVTMNCANFLLPKN